MIFKDNLNNLSELEKEIIKYIEDNSNEIPNMSITDLANETYSSISTVSRAVKKSGMDGFSELRYKCSLLDKSNHQIQDINEIMNKSLKETIRTIDNLSVEDINNAIDLISESKKAFIISNGLSSIVADEFDLKLNILGYNTFNLNDENIIRNIDKLITKDDVLIVITLYDTLKNLSISAEKAKEVGANVIQISCNEESRIKKFSDVNIYGYKQDNRSIKDFEVSSRLPLFIITRTIIDYLVLSKQINFANQEYL